MSEVSPNGGDELSYVSQLMALPELFRRVKDVPEHKESTYIRTYSRERALRYSIETYSSRLCYFRTGPGSCIRV